MKQTKEISALLTAAAACEAACIANATESSAASGQEKVAKRSTECAGESRELRRQLAKNPKASISRFQAACDACVAECEHGGQMSTTRTKCVEACRAASLACSNAAKSTSASLK
jgi:hypothetical protein